MSIATKNINAEKIQGELAILSVSATTYLGLPLDIRVTGGTYNSGTATFTNNTGGTFSVSGFNSNPNIVITGGTYNESKGSTTLVDNQGNSFEIDGYFTPLNDIYVTGGTFNGTTLNLTGTNGLDVNVTGFTSSSGVDVFVTGGTYNQASSTITFTNNTGGTFNVTGITISGGSSTGVDVFVTGGTYTASASTITFTNNTGGTFNVTGLITSGGGIPSSIVGAYRMYRGTVGFEVIPSVDRFWIASPTDNRVDYFVASSGLYIGGFTVTAAFGVIYVASLNEVWVTSSSSTTIQRYNPSTGVSLGSFSGGGNGGLSYVELSPTRLYICNVNSNSVSEINPSTLSVTTTITASAMGMTSCNDFTYVNNPASQHYQYLSVVSTAAAEFAAIDTNTNAVVINGTSVSGSILSPYSITYNPFNDRYYITSTSAQFQVNLYNPNTTTSLLFDNFITSRFARQIACDVTTGKVYCTGLLASSIITMPVTLQCFNPIGMEWATTTLSSNADTGAFNSYIKLDIVNKYAYVSGWTTAVTPNIITVIKI